MFVFFLLLAALSGCAIKKDMSHLAQFHRQLHEMTEYQDKSRSSTVRLLTDKGLGTGTYVMYKGQTFIMTAAHVAEDSNMISVILDSHIVQTEVLYIDKEKEICVLLAKTLVHPIEVRIVPIEIFANEKS